MTGIEGLYNFRDTGGTPLNGGGETRPDILYRSAALSALTPTGIDQLAATDIGVVVDFRMANERQSAPDRLPTSRPFRAVDLSILEGAVAGMAKQFFQDGASQDSEAIAKAMSTVPTLDEMYVEMLQGGASAFAEVARLIAASTDDTPTAVLVHCTAGKDRTGTSVALMLDAVGAERAAVVADYAASQDNLQGPWAEGMIHSVTSLGIPMTPALRTLLTKTPPEAMEKALAWVDDGYGGAGGYLRSGGLSDDELAQLRTRLVG